MMPNIRQSSAEGDIIVSVGVTAYIRVRFAKYVYDIGAREGER